MSLLSGSWAEAHFFFCIHPPAEAGGNLEEIKADMTSIDTVLRLVRNKYANNPGKRAAWLSASHVEKAPKKKEPPTP
jgi:hypothetical protein